MQEENFFLSKNSIIRHKEYLKNLNLNYSILEKSNPKLSGCSSGEILKLRIGAEEKCEAYKLKREIELHELYFKSFDMYSSPQSRKGAEAVRLIELFYSAKEDLKQTENPKFLCFYINRHGEIAYNIVESYSSPPLYGEFAAIDLFEHAYIFDYGYNREKYLEEAFRFINLKQNA